MTQAPESHVAVGLNDYRFVASLHVQHPSISPDKITVGLGLQPRRVRIQGEKKQTRSGKQLAGSYAENHWNADLTIASEGDVSDFLLDFIDRQIAGSTELTRQIDDSGGSVTVFVGLFAKGCCDFQIPAATLRRLGDAGVTVRLDYYGENKDHASLTDNPSNEGEPDCTV